VLLMLGCRGFRSGGGETVSRLGELFILMVGLEDAGDNLPIPLAKSLERWISQAAKLRVDVGIGGDDKVRRWHPRPPVVGYGPGRVVIGEAGAGAGASYAGVAIVGEGIGGLRLLRLG